jgi:hypothetical protein
MPDPRSTLDPPPLVLYARSVGSAPEKPEKPNETGPWSLVEPFLFVSNQLITLAEALSEFTFATLGALGSRKPDPDNERPTASIDQQEATARMAAGATETNTTLRDTRTATNRVRRVKPVSRLSRDALPKMPTSRRLHQLPCGDNRFFLWHRLPETSSTRPLELREFSASTGAETRRIELSRGTTSLYLAMPPGATKHWIELGHEIDGAWVAASEPCEIHPTGAPADAAAGSRSENS